MGLKPEWQANMFTILAHGFSVSSHLKLAGHGDLRHLAICGLNEALPRHEDFAQ